MKHKSIFERSAPAPDVESTGGSGREQRNTQRRGEQMSTVVFEQVRDLVDAITDGHLDARADLRDASGAEREMLEDINQLVDTLVEPLNTAIEFTDLISRGEKAEKITGEYKGDFNALKNNCNRFIDRMDDFVDEVGVLLRGAEAGTLDVRADAGKFKGVWRKLLKGMNGVVNAIVAPLNVAAEYVDRISKGDIPERITDDYKGDFNEIKNNLNLLIDAMP